MGTPDKGRLSKERKNIRKKAVAQAVSLFTDKNKAPAKSVHLSDMAAELLRVFKGPRGFACRVYLQYLAVPDGHPTRTKILDMILKLTVSDSAQNSTSGTEVDDITDEELDAELNSVLVDGMEEDVGDPYSEEDRKEVEAALAAQELQDPEIAAMELGNWLIVTPDGRRMVKRMILDDLDKAVARRDFAHAARLRMVMQHFCKTHPDNPDRAN